MSDEDQAVDTTEVNEDAGQEASPDENVSNELVEQGRKFKELQDKYPEVNWEELPKGFTQATQKLAALEKAKEQVQPTSNLTPEEIERRRQADAFLEDPYVKEKIFGAVNQTVSEREKIIREDIAFDEYCKGLESVYDGSDGNPKFSREEVVKYGAEHGIKDPKAAYRDMNFDKIQANSIKNALTRKPKPIFSEKRGGTGSKLPNPKQVSSMSEARQRALARKEAYES